MKNHAKHITSLFLDVHMTYMSNSSSSFMHTTYQEANKYIKSITSMAHIVNIHLITIKVSKTIFNTIRKSTITLPWSIQFGLIHTLKMGTGAFP